MEATMLSERVAKLLGAPERRELAVSDFEFRRNGDTLEFSGYAATFGQEYPVFGGAEAGGWDESVDRRAFDVTLREKPDLHLLVNHEGLPLARTKSGTLTLSADSKGLFTKAPLDRRDPDVQRLEVKMERRDIDQMSFAFRTVRHEWDEENAKRSLLEVSLHKGDVSIVNFGANPNTSAQLRGLEPVLDYLADLSVEDALVEVRSLDGSRDRLVAAHDALGQLLREAVPPAQRRLSVVEAVALMERT